MIIYIFRPNGGANAGTYIFADQSRSIPNIHLPDGIHMQTHRLDGPPTALSAQRGSMFGSHPVNDQIIHHIYIYIFMFVKNPKYTYDFE